MKNSGLTISACLILVSAATVHAQQPVQAAGDSFRDQIIAQERAGLDALKTGDMTTFGDSTADDAVFVDAHGPAGKALILEHTAAFRLHDYTMSGIQVIPVSPEGGLIVYKIDETGTSHGKEFKASVHVSALWVKRAGKWQCVFSQETAAK